MINLINVSDIPTALMQGANLIIISADSTKALVGGTLNDITVEHQYEDSELNSLLNDSFWKQPCTNCEGE